MLKKIKDWNLTTKWTLAYSALILLVTGTMAFGLYLQLRSAGRSALRERLGDIVNFAAPLVDGDYHALIRAPGDENGSFYRVVYLRLQSIQETSDVIEHIYTLRQGEDETITYVVDVDPDSPAPIGQEYTRPSPLLSQGLSDISEATVEDLLHKNSSGIYLSGYAPIYDQFRDLDGVLGIDIDASTIIANEVRARKIALLAFVTTLPLTFLLGWWLARYLTAPMTDLMDGVERITQGQLDQTVPVHSQDETGVLANAFNTMTRKLRETMRGLEHEITEHRRVEKVQNTVYRISQAMISTENIDDLYRSIHTILGELISVENFYIALYDPIEDLIKFSYFQDQVTPNPIQLRPGQGMAGYIMRQGEPILLTEESLEQFIDTGKAMVEGKVPVDWMGVPLKVNKQIIGVMAAQSYSEEVRYTQENLSLFEFVSTQVALAIERKRSQAAEQKHATRLARSNALIEALSRVAAKIDPTHNPDQVLSVLGEELDSLRFKCLITLLDSEGKQMQFHYTNFPPRAVRIFEKLGGQKMSQHRFSPKKIVLPGRDIKTSQILSLEESAEIFAQILPGFTKELTKRAFKKIIRVPNTSVIHLPLQTENTPLGALWLIGEDVQERDLPALSVFARQAAITIENARLFKQVQHLAVTDELTGLHNRRNFFELGEQEFERSLRYSKPLAAIMFDFDNFKEINDTQGHLIGDEAIHNIAQRCSENIREFDILGRYGGDEFGILLPETSKAKACQLANRLHRLVTKRPVETSVGELPITISLGVAAVDDDTPDLKTLLARADAALYSAKQGGRNRVCSE